MDGPTESKSLRFSKAPSRLRHSLVPVYDGALGFTQAGPETFRSRPLGGESETLVIGVYIFSSCLTRNQTSACTVQRPTPRRSQDTPTYEADYKQCLDFPFGFFERNRIKSRICTKTGRSLFKMWSAYVGFVFIEGRRSFLITDFFV